MISVLFFVLLAALIGGLMAKLLKLPSMVGFILAGVVGKLIFSFDHAQTENIAELGVILLLFSVGLEISLEKLVKVGKIAIVGSILQIIIVTAISFWILVTLLNINPEAAVVLSLAFAMSSTALIVKVMQEKEELGTIQYDILMGWALIQDLAVIPIVVLLPTLALGNSSAWASVAVSSLLTTALVLGVVFLTGKLIAPYLTRLAAKTNDREFLLLLAICLALGIASIVTLFGISAAFGAFLAGIVISKTQENHAIFSETRPLRDIFTTLFFVSLGFLVSPLFVVSHFATILILALVIILLKTLVIFFLCEFFGYKGKTAISVSIGLAQIGEFAFVLLLIAKELGILNDELSQIGIATTVVTLLISPLLIREVTPISKILKKVSEQSRFKNLFTTSKQLEAEVINLQNHIVICGFGRMGKWIAKALREVNVDFIVIDYNHKVIHDAAKEGLKAVYGDASSSDILQEVNIKDAKAIIITVPDMISQEDIITFCQTNFPTVKIMARAHLDSDLKKLSTFKIQKVVQPEFEAALSIIKSILINSGHSKEDVTRKLKSLRLSRANN